MRTLQTLTLAASALVAAGLAAPLPAARAASPNVVRYEFVLAPGGSKTIGMPVILSPVDMLVSLSAENNGTQTPSALAHALVNEDPKSRELTWIGTSSDGTTVAGTTLSSSEIAIIGPSPGNLIITAVPGGADSPLGKLVFTQSAAQTTIDIRYVVTLIY